MNSKTVFDETNLIWSGQRGASLPEWDSKQSIGSAILDALAKFPDKIGQVNFGVWPPTSKTLFVFFILFPD